MSVARWLEAAGSITLDQVTMTSTVFSMNQYKSMIFGVFWTEIVSILTRIWTAQPWREPRLRYKPGERNL